MSPIILRNTSQLKKNYRDSEKKMKAMLNFQKVAFFTVLYPLLNSEETHSVPPQLINLSNNS
jgi:hypothetical protein